VVDLNPRKWGRFLPVTAHQVTSPDTLPDVKPAAVIITNPAYKSEITAALSGLGLSAQVLVA
jgi:hypothetical protein